MVRFQARITIFSDFNTMKILLLGHDGQLGTDCWHIFQKKYDLLSPSMDELNLCSKEQTQTYILQEKPDVVINCAAYTAVDNCENERELCNTINGDAPGNIAEACGTIDCRFIHVSTDYVFDGHKTVPEPYKETDKVNPLSHYGKTKLRGEQLIQQKCDNFIILRTAWLYSAHGPNFLKTMLRITLDDPHAVRKVVHDQFGSLTWSKTLARQIDALLPSPLHGIVHATSEGCSSWYEAACFFLEEMGIHHNLTPCQTKEYPTPAHRPANSILENAALKENGLSLFVDWRTDVEAFVAEYRDVILGEYEKQQN